jgi:glutamate formiminotransferase/formiminotetrahydrofolate cyclodeaminase
MGETSASRLAAAITAFADELDDGGAEPVSGSVAALVTALAASLASAAADRSRAEWEEAGGARAQAQALRRRAVELAERDAAAYALAREAYAQRGSASDTAEMGEDQEARDWRLGDAVERAAEPPLQVAATAADVAELARAIADRGAGDVRADALIAAALAAAAARAAAHLVRINLVVGRDQAPAALAQSYADAAGSAAASFDPAEL